MKKVLSVFLSLLMVLSVIGVPAAAADETAENTAVSYLNEDFENAVIEKDKDNFDCTGNFSLISSAAATSLLVDSEYAAAKPFNSKVLKMHTYKETGSGLYPRIAANFENISLTEKKPNTFVEAELDFAVPNMASGKRGLIILNDSKGANILTATLEQSGKMYINNYNINGSISGAVNAVDGIRYNTSEINKFKVVMQLTDSKGEAVNKVTSIIVNGTDYLSGKEPIAFLNKNVNSGESVAANFNQIIFQTYVRKSSDTFTDMIGYIDNARVAEYSLANADDEAPTPDYYAYEKGVEAAYNDYNANFAETSGDLKQYTDAYKAAIDNAIRAYYDKSSAKSDFVSALSALSAAKETLSEVAKYLPSKIWNQNFNSLADDASWDLSSSAENAEIEGYKYIREEGQLTLSAAQDADGGKMLKMSRSETATGNWPRFSADFSGTPVDLTEEAGKNAYAEYSFDFKINKADSVKTQNTVFILKDTSSRVNVFSLLINPSGWIYYNYDEKGSNLPVDHRVNMVSIGDKSQLNPNELNRIKLVMQLTGENGEKVQKVTQICVNGKNLISEPLEFLNCRTDGTTYDSSKGWIDGTIYNGTKKDSVQVDKLYFNPGRSIAKDDNVLYIDNLSIYKYNLKNPGDVSPVRDDAALKLAIEQKESEAVSIVQGRFSSIKAEFDALLAEMKAAYEDKTAGGAEVNRLIAKAGEMTEKMKSLNHELVFEENFEGYTEDVSEETAYDTGKALKVTGSKYIELPKTYIGDATAQHGKNLWTMTEFDLKTENIADGFYPSITWTGKNDGDNTASKVVNSITLYKNFVRLAYDNGNGGNNVSIYKKLNDGEWNRIRLVTQLTDENGGYVGLNKKLYVNGDNLLSVTADVPGSKLCSGAADAGYIDSFNIYAKGDSTTLYIDNLKVTRFYEEDLEDVNYGQLLTSIRKGEKALSGAEPGKNITAEIYGAYSAALEKAKGIYDAKPALSETEIANDELCRAYSKLIFADKAYEIGAVSFADKNGEDTSYITPGGKITTVKAIKNAEYNKQGLLILALYKNDGTLIDAKAADEVFGGLGAGEEKTVNFDMALPEDVEGVYAKVMLLDNKENLMPLTKAFVPGNTEKRTVFVAGDSIVQTYDDSIYPRQGWGKYAVSYLNENIGANNLAVSGYTTRTFVGFGKFEKIENDIKEGDVIYVSFMANDSSKGSIKRVNEYDYKNMLRLYADTAKKNGAEIIFITSPAVLPYDASTQTVGYNGYTELMKEVAEEYNAPFIDIWQKTIDLQIEKGRAYVEAGMHINNMDVLKANFTEKEINESKFNSTDKTHISEWGAKKVASWITGELKNTNSVLRYYATGETFDFPAGMKTSENLTAE